MFQFVEPVVINRLKHINLRQEAHGKQKVSAVDLDFVLEGNNGWLSLLHDDLRESLYHDPDAEVGQETLSSVPKVLQKLRFPRMGALPWDQQQSGMDLAVIYGLGDEFSRVEFADGKVTVKRFEAKEDGIAHIFWRYSTAAIPDGAIDELRKRVDSLVELTLIQQERLQEEQGGTEATGADIDGTQAAFEADHPTATDLFAQQNGDPEDGADGEGSETDAQPA